MAGKVVTQGGIGSWFRPISNRGTGELSEEDRRFENGQDPKLLDVINVPVVGPQPHGYQTENYLIDDSSHWTLVRRGTADEVKAAIDVVKGPIWDNSSSSYNGLNDRVDDATAAALTSSLLLIEVRDLKIQVAVEGAEYRKRKVRGQFSYDGFTYLLAVTDPKVERAYFSGKDGVFDVGRALLCVSLGEPYGGYAYKLIAGMILPSEI